MNARCEQVSGATIITPQPEALAPLRSLHNYMGRLAETTPESLTDTPLAHDLEGNLLVAMGATLNSTAPHHISGSRHRFVVEQFRALVHAQPADRLTTANIEQNIEGSGRTLRAACQLVLGLSPHQYVIVNRLNFSSSRSATG